MGDRIARPVRRKLEGFEKSGMGYWIVTADLGDGRRFANVAITDDWRLGFPELCPFHAADIIDVRWDGHRGSNASGQPLQLDTTTHWVYVDGGRELTPVMIDGINVWKHDWTRLPGDPVAVKDPLHGRDFHFPVYRITDRHRSTVVAAGEFSNGMWGFFQPRPADH